MALVAGQNDTGGLGRASGQSFVESASRQFRRVGRRKQCAERIDDRVHRLLADRPFAGLALLQLDRKVAAPLRDLLVVDRRARCGAVGEPELEGGDPLERRAVLVAPESSSSSLSRGSRNEITAARTLLSPSPALKVKRSELSSATQRMYEPAKQSACCSATSVRAPSSSGRPGAESHARTRGPAHW